MDARQTIDVRAAIDGDPYDRILEQLDRTNLTKDQLLIWAGQRLRPSAPSYRETGVLHIHAPIDAAVFLRSVEMVVRGGDVLRTTVEVVDGWPRQVVRETVEAPLETLDLSNEADPEATLGHHVSRLASRDEDISGRLFRLVLFRLGPVRFALYVAQHQLISDAWSFGVLSHRLSETYATLCHGRAGLPDRWPQFGEYLAYERALRRSSTYQRSAAYWAEKLRAPRDRLYPHSPGAADAEHRVERASRGIALEAVHALEQLVAMRRVPRDLGMCSAILAILAIYLRRERGAERFAIGVPFSNRPTARFKQTLGSFMHVCPISVQIEPGDTFASLRDRLEQELVETARHQHYATRNPILDPAYEVVLNFHKQSPLVQDFAGAGVHIEWPTTGFGDRALALHIRSFSHRQDLTLDLDCSTALFRDDQRNAALDEIQRLLCTFSAEPGLAIERHARPAAVAETAEFEVGDGPRRSLERPTFVARLQRALLSNAARTAVVSENGSATFSQLGSLASRVALWLQDRGAVQESLVAILAQRGIPSWATVLGVLEAGAAFLPLDPAHPPDRLRSILEGSRPEFLLADRRHRELARSLIGTGWRGVGLIEDLVSTDSAPVTGIAEPMSSQLAYVIYTSGSTGVPKGAMLEHGGVANHLYAKIDALGLGPTDRVSQTASHAFDVSVWQFFAPLLVGATTVLLSDEVARDPRRLIDAASGERLTVLATVPSLLGPLLARIERASLDARAFPELRWLVSTGEPLPPALCRRWFERFPSIPILNAYGPTECSDDVTHFALRRPPDDGVRRIPIGRPIANTSVYILDSAQRAVVAGDEGDLWVGGAGVGRGYRNEPELTTRAFVADPFSEHAYARMYRTGDTARRLPDGTLDLIGRSDRALKVRGSFVDLSEVEAALASHPHVLQAAVLAAEGREGSRRLVAFVAVPPTSLPAEGSDARAASHGKSERESRTLQLSRELRRFLAARLPSFMLPHGVVILDELPLTSSGKVDRGALASSHSTWPAGEGDRSAPRSEVEEVLTKIWRDLLGLDEVGVCDDFLECGGDSLIAIQVAGRIEVELGVSVAASVPLEHRTVAELAEFVARCRECPPSPAVDRMSASPLALLDEVEAAPTATSPSDQRSQSSRGIV